MTELAAEETFTIALVFSGRFPDVEKAKDAMGEIVTDLVLEKGYECAHYSVAQRVEGPSDCGCDCAAECDQREKCMFT